MNMLSEQEKQQVREKAWQIMKEFSKELEKVEHEKIPHALTSETGTRPESDSVKCDNEFRELMFKNAPKKNHSSIIAEKGEWA